MSYNSSLFLIHFNENNKYKALEIKYSQDLKKSNYIFNNNFNIENIILKRNAGIDLVRTLSMLSIITTHILYHGQVMNKYKQYEDELSLLDILTCWNVNSFGLISGIVGFKTNKYSNILYLWFCVSFYSVSIRYIFYIIRPLWVINSKLLYECFPVIFHKYWYFSKYFGMYLFLPVINKGIFFLNQKELKILTISMFCIFIIWKDTMNPKFDTFCMIKGNSVLWLLILYITGSYIGKYRINYNGIHKLLFCLFCIFIFVSSSLLTYIFTKNKITNINNFILIILKKIFIRRLNSFPMLLQSISITLLLMQINYSRYISKIISFIGPLTFGVYLIHENCFVRYRIVRIIFKKYSSNIPLKTVIKLIIMSVAKIFSLSIFIDYLRNLLFAILRLKKFLVFFDKIIY